ncbi:MAG: hypothetical protein IJN54_01115 [Lachnospiraceae bacterium]|nr:hypothetical protein [Lachnospiraceae bacterium]
MTLMNDPAFQGYFFEEQINRDNSSVMIIKNETGEGCMRCLDTFSGITFSYNSLKMKSCYQQVAPMKGFISLNYCREGCFQVTLNNGKVYFLQCHLDKKKIHLEQMCRNAYLFFFI